MPIVTKNRWFDQFSSDQLPPSVAGKVFVITGTTSGLGYRGAKIILEKGGEVVALNRKSSRVVDATAKLVEELDNIEDESSLKLVNVECDLQNFASVKAAIRQIKQKYDKIYCLANIAGIGGGDDVTVDGYDRQAQTNHLSHFLLAAELFPLLATEAQSTGDARIVHMSSGAKDMVNKTGLEQKYFEKQPPEDGSTLSSSMTRYGQTKLSNVVFTHALHNRIQQNSAIAGKVKAICANPGAMGKDMTNELSWFPRQLFYLFIKIMGQSTEDGCMGMLLGMMASEDSNGEAVQSGVLYGPKNGGMSGPAVANVPPKPYENDPKSIDMLWKASELATGVTFTV